ncbi:MAG: hypothetical protein ABFS45_11040 [Pseudomonadota bacterium]
MFLEPAPSPADPESLSMLCITMYNRELWLLALAWLLLVGLMLGNEPSLAGEIGRQQMLGQPEKISGWIVKKQLRFEQIPNPHWNNNDCIACHRKTPVGAKLHLRGKSIDELCEYCHSGVFDHSYIHPTSVPLKGDMRKRLPTEFADNLDAKKRLSCATCHEIEAQCLTKRRNEQRINPLFFRSGPYRGRTELCFKCHDESGYQRRNAHDQIGDDGKIKANSCRICHDKTEGLERAGNIQEVGFNVKDNLVRVCGGCHVLKPHPSGNYSFSSTKGEPNHLVVPSKEIRGKMQESEKAHDVVLPLDPITGRVFCATCHNPHEKGVIKDKAAAKGADEPKRLRTKNICTNCHDK